MKLCEAKPHHNKRSLYYMRNVHLNKSKKQYRTVQAVVNLGLRRTHSPF